MFERLKLPSMAGRRGQSALEYLMTYGWALVVLVIVVAALFFLGILNPATYQGKTCSGFSKLAYAGEHDFNGTHFKGKFQNNAGFAIDLNNANPTFSISGSSATTVTYDTNTNIAPGGTFIVTATGGLGTFTSNTSYSGNLTMKYNKRGSSSIIITESGTCTGVVP